ncbi:hypothetical protein V2G26_009940 [Clonostachys chloroleuca]
MATLDLNLPAGLPPDGVTPNFENPSNNNALAWGVLLLCQVISTICLVLRGYARVFLLRKFNAEEVFILLAFGAFWGCSYAMFKIIEVPGFFVHQWDVLLRDVIPMNYNVYIYGQCYSFAMPFLKIAILIEWINIFVPGGFDRKSIFFWGCSFMIFVQAAALVGIVLALNLQCKPHRAIWDIRVQGDCFPISTIQISSGIIFLISDIVILLLPQHIIWKLKLKTSKKIGVSIVFGLGLLACVCAAVRLSDTMKLVHNTNDAVYFIGVVGFWAFAEMTCGFFICCLPCIPKILHDTGVLRSIKRKLGMNTATTAPSSANRYGTNGSSSRRNYEANHSTSYYKLDEDGVPMTTIGGTQSTEYLHGGQNGSDIGQPTLPSTTRGAHSTVDKASSTKAWRP